MTGLIFLFVGILLAAFIGYLIIDKFLDELSVAKFESPNKFEIDEMILFEGKYWKVINRKYIKEADLYNYTIKRSGGNIGM